MVVAGLMQGSQPHDLGRGRQFIIQGPPVPQGRPRVTRSGRVYYSQKQTAYRKQLISAFLAQNGGLGEFDGPVHITILLSRPRRNSDLDNHAKMILDALVQAGILDDDRSDKVRGLSIRAVWQETAYTNIWIHKWNDALIADGR